MNTPVERFQVRTTCPYCGVGCGVLASPDGKGGAAISGDPLHPANYGRLCSKGSALGETLGLETRLLHPMVRDAAGTLVRTGWEEATRRVADGFTRALDRHGPDAIAFYLSGQLLTEDYYVANKLMKGFLGSANVDTNSRLCMASSVAGHRRAFGSDTVPGCYADLDEADLIVLVGSNAAWCHPVLFQRMIKAKAERGAKLVVIDPRRTATAEDADLFLPICPGMDTVLFSGLLTYLARDGALDRRYISEHTEGFATALRSASGIAGDLSEIAEATGLDAGDIARFYALFAATERVVTCFSQGVNQSAQGTDKVNAIINCHLATGRIGRPGMGPFSLTGQPNAMGGREVGGLANQLAAHMGFSPEEVDRVGRFWGAPRMAAREGLKAVDMFDAIERGEIKALWVMATNPAVSLPRASAVRDALAKLELFVVSENVLSNDTIAAGAHILLPAAAWGEKDGTVTNSERRISRQRAFLDRPGEARPDWRIVSDVAAAMGHGKAFAYASAADVFREHAALSAFENAGTRDFDIGGLAGLGEAHYAGLEPVQWPRPPGEQASRPRLFAEGGFFTPDRKARFIAPAVPALGEETCEALPFRLNTGRIRDQWHSMTRTGLSPRLGSHLPEPFVEIHPLDALRHGIVDGEFARVTTAHGTAVQMAVVTDTQQPGSLFAPIHWTAATSSGRPIGALVAPRVDPHSGQPEAKATPASIAAAHFRYRGFLLLRSAGSLECAEWWSKVAVAGGTGFLFASNLEAAYWRRAARLAFREPHGLAEYADDARGIYRVAVFQGTRLEACLFFGPRATIPSWTAVTAIFAADGVSAVERRALLSGRPAGGGADPGPLVCACFGVGLAAIRDAIAKDGTTSTEDIGKALRAGTNCGSCLPEIRSLLRERESVPAG